MKNINPLNIILLPLFLCMLMTGCDSRSIYDKFKDTPEGIWDRTQLFKFDVEIEDTAAIYNVFINLRHTGDYKYSNVYMFLNTVFPDKKVSRDTVDCVLADDKGKWMGKGLGDIKDNQFLLKRNVRLRQKGIYTFEFEQAMRVEKLEGIKSVGIRIETAE